MDVMAGVLLEDGSELKLVTGIDDHSRFCVAAGLVRRAVSRAVCGVLLVALERYGVPDEILTDNGKVFTGRYGPRPARSCSTASARAGHRPPPHRRALTGPTGKIERFHQSLRREFLDGRVFASFEHAQAEIDAWVS